MTTEQASKLKELYKFFTTPIEVVGVSMRVMTEHSFVLAVFEAREVLSEGKSEKP